MFVRERILKESHIKPLFSLLKEIELENNIKDSFYNHLKDKCLKAYKKTFIQNLFQRHAIFASKKSLCAF